MFERNRSKKVELLAKVYAHAKHAYKFGFHMLTLGWSDGSTFLPVNSILLSTDNKKNRINEAAAVDKRTVGYKRRRLALEKKTPKMFFRYDGEDMSLISIYNKNKKRSGRSKYLLSVMVDVLKDGEIIPAKVVYVRNRNKWKEYLHLSEECRSISFDTMAAHTAVVFTRYMMLSLENRESNDERSFGQLFLYFSDEMSDITWILAFELMLQMFRTLLADQIDIAEEKIDKL